MERNPAGSNWNAANWVGGSGASSAAAPGDVLVFDSSTITGLNNDFGAGTSFAGITFNANAAAFTLNGNDITLSGPINVNSGGNIAETIGLNMTGDANSGINMSSSTSITGNNLTLNGNVSVGTLLANGVNTSGTTPSNTLTIAANKTLTLTGGLTVGLQTATNDARTQLAITGGGTLVVGTGSGTMLVNNLGNTATAIQSTLDLSTLGFFQLNGATGGSLALGAGSRGAGTLILSNTGNLISATTINLGVSSGNNASTGTLVVGTGTTTINSDNITIGGLKGGGGVLFANASNGTLKIRGAGGTNADRANITLGNRSGQGTPSPANMNLGTHAIDFELGTLQFQNLNANNAGSINGSFATLTFGGGLIDVNNIAMVTKTSGNTTINSAGTATTTFGTFTMNGGNLLVNQSFVMTTVNSTVGAGTNLLTSAFNVFGGTATINSDITQSGSNAANNIVTLDGGTLNMTGHSIGSNSASITLNANSGTLMNVGQINGGMNGITKATTGTLFVVGSNGYTGDTVINSGALVINGSTPASGNVAVNNAILSGSGNGTTTGVTGLVTLQSGGQIRPGPAATDGSVGTLTMNSLTVNGGDFRFDLTSPSTASDQIHVLGNANFTAGSTISPIFPGAAQAGSYTLLTANSLIGTAPSPNVPSSNTRTVYTVHFGDVVANAITLDVSGQSANLTWVGNVASGGANDLGCEEHTQLDQQRHHRKSESVLRPGHGQF